MRTKSSNKTVISAEENKNHSFASLKHYNFKKQRQNDTFK